MPGKLLILEPFCKEHVDLIAEAAGEGFEVVQLPRGVTRKTMIEELKTAEIVIGQPDNDLLQNPETNCPKLRLVQMTWAGTDQYTRSVLPFPWERIVLCNASGAYGQVISQFVIAQLLSLMLGFKTYHTQQEQKIWQRRGPIQSLEGAKVLIYGAGDIGTVCAKRLTGFDTYTIGVCRSTDRKRDYFDRLCTLEEAEQYLPTVDVVIGCIPNSEQTAGYFDARRLALLKEGAVIVNVGRGNFIDCMALSEELDRGHLWGAALDVTNPEPLPTDHPLWENPRCIITPHTSGTAFEHLKATEDLLCKIACENVRAYNRALSDEKETIGERDDESIPCDLPFVTRVMPRA